MTLMTTRLMRRVWLLIAVLSMPTIVAFVLPRQPRPQENNNLHRTISTLQAPQLLVPTATTTIYFSSIPPIIFLDNSGDGEEEEGDDAEDDDEEEESDPYIDVASSEFLEEETKDSSSSSMVHSSLMGGGDLSTTTVDWGGALGRLRERVGDVESGDSQNPSKVLFRLMSSQSPNQAIGSFVSKANPQVVQAMSGAVGSLLGGLSNPQSGVEMVVKATGDKIGSLCFQLQMTGYMFRNAEYVMALKEIMDLSGSATLQDYKDAFDKLDKDDSGYIEAGEIQELLDNVYSGKVPTFEIETFINFFDQDNDGRVSWEEFKRGLGAVMVSRAEEKSKLQKLLGSSESKKIAKEKQEEEGADDEDDEEEVENPNVSVSGTLEIELDDGTTVQVDADEYMKSLKAEASALKNELRRQKRGKSGENQVSEFLAGGNDGPAKDDPFGGLANYVASRQGDIKSLTEGISPEIVDTMKMLVDFVLEGGQSGKGRPIPKKEQMEMEIPGSALQQLALWQLILGYQLREAEAKGDYLKLLE
mmetsp:Transcript_25893/g.60968  ORF Transcript_25893/g.60968 Transcript_25893/m.60968 type:complete len:530 (-) Transcript_25893:119-1708(-)